MEKTIVCPQAYGKYIRIDHPSGVTVFYYPTPNKSKSCAMIATRFGSINRVFQKRDSEEWMTAPDGIAHFLEHKLFEGPQGNAFDFYAKTGAKANAFTSNDKTAYYFIAADRFYDSFEILLQFIKNPYFTPENVEKEKGIIGQEIRMYDDEATWRGYLALTKALYQKHPVRIDIAGTEESIAPITDQTLYDCYNVFYDNSNLALFIAGDLELDKILALCNKKLGTAHNTQIRQKFPKEPEEIKCDFSEIQMDIARPVFFIGIKDCEGGVSGPDGTRHDICVKLLSDALFGPSGAFYSRLYKDGVINSEFSVDYERGVGYGFLLFSGESDNAHSVLKAVREICDHFDENAISEEMFVRVRNALYGDLIRMLDSANAIVNKFLNNWICGCDIFEELRALETVSLQEVNETAAKLLNRNRIALSLVNPQKER